MGNYQAGGPAGCHDTSYYTETEIGEHRDKGARAQGLGS